MAGPSPDKGFGMLIGEVQVVTDGRLQGLGAPMDAPADLLLSKQPKPALHQIEPGGAGWREVHLESGSLGQPPQDEGDFVSPVVVHDEVDVQFGGHGGIDGIQELTELTKRKAFLRSFIERMEVHVSEATIRYRLTMPRGEKTLDRVSVLPIDTLWWANVHNRQDL